MWPELISILELAVTVAIAAIVPMNAAVVPMNPFPTNGALVLTEANSSTTPQSSQPHPSSCGSLSCHPVAAGTGT